MDKEGGRGDGLPQRAQCMSKGIDRTTRAWKNDETMMSLMSSIDAICHIFKKEGHLTSH